MSESKYESDTNSDSKPFDANRIKKDFPALNQTVNGKPLVYLDSAATSQKPNTVINTISGYYSSRNSNVHRGLHYLSELATREYEATRDAIRVFINAQDVSEIIFTSGTTDSINLVSHSYGRSTISMGDEIIVSAMEHHSNIVPWQILCEEKGALLRVIPVNDNGELCMNEFRKLFSKKTKLLSIVHISNALGTINPVKRMVEIAHSFDVPVLVDGAQSIPHIPVDVQDIGCDFFAFSGHKVFGPTGIGVLYGKREYLENMPPYKSGGDMIKSVSFDKTLYNALPYKFEAGTPNIAGVAGLGSAIKYLENIDREAALKHEQNLTEYGRSCLSEVPGLRFIGASENKASILSFVLDGIHAHDVGTILDADGVAIRAGHHCTQPLMERFGINASARASISFYNIASDIDALVNGVYKTVRMFG